MKMIDDDKAVKKDNKSVNFVLYIHTPNFVPLPPPQPPPPSALPLLSTLHHPFLQILSHIHFITKSPLVAISGSDGGDGGSGGGAIQAGRIPGSIVKRFFELEKSPFLGWLLRFGGFKERLLADDIFLTKVGIECGVGIFTKTAAELEKRRKNFTKELDFVFADVVALAGTSYSFLQGRIGAIVRNGAKLFAVGTGASLV